MHHNRPRNPMLGDPFYIGFADYLSNLSYSKEKREAAKYPPYNLVSEGDHYRLTFAVAGFKEDELEVSTERDLLKVSGKKEAAETKGEYLHKGISSRDFAHDFKLGPHLKVQGASLSDGLLHIELERVLPEEMKPRKISISREPLV